MDTATAKGGKAILFDMVRCAACGKCVAACMAKQGFPGDPKDVKDLSSTSYTCLKEKDGSTYRNLCRHCLRPSCVSVCPVGALEKTALGPVTYDFDKCIGCRYCILACPFNVPRYEWDKATPAVRKCDMCHDRVKEGGQPACAEACEYDATMFGTREEMLALARSRIAEDPDEYLDHVYGETEIGGTSVLFLAPFEMPEWGFRADLGTTPLPVLTEGVLHKLPGIVVMAGAALMGVWWMTNRRDEVAAWEAGQAKRAASAERHPAGTPHGNGKES